MTASHRALDFRFVFDADDPTIAAYLAELYEAVTDTSTISAAATTEAHAFRIATVAAVEADGDDAPRYDVHFDDDELATRATVPDVVDAIVQRVNSSTVASSRWLISHASSVSHDGEAVVFAAHSESGKSTLAAGLVRAGFAYVTDEAVAFDWESGRIDPYPKPISLDPGSWGLFPELDPRGRIGGGAPFLQWHVPVDAIDHGRVSPSCRARWVVFPMYRADAETRVTPITRGEALVEWAKNTFRFNEQSRAALTLLAGIVPEVECYRMVVGDLDDAITCVTELVGA